MQGTYLVVWVGYRTALAKIAVSRVWNWVGLWAIQVKGHVTTKLLCITSYALEQRRWSDNHWLRDVATLIEWLYGVGKIDETLNDVNRSSTVAICISVSVLCDTIRSKWIFGSSLLAQLNIQHRSAKNLKSLE